MEFDDLVTWRALISEEMKAHKEGWPDVESCTLTDDQLDHTFSRGFEVPMGLPFTVWTKKRVYFPTCDGDEGVASVARDPDGEPTAHVGDY